MNELPVWSTGEMILKAQFRNIWRKPLPLGVPNNPHLLSWEWTWAFTHWIKAYQRAFVNTVTSSRVLYRSLNLLSSGEIITFFLEVPCTKHLECFFYGDCVTVKFHLITNPISSSRPIQKLCGYGWCPVPRCLFDTAMSHLQIVHWMRAGASTHPVALPIFKFWTSWKSFH